jgi:pimeloyl-ACP methyl ester carboxylesterase
MYLQVKGCKVWVNISGPSGAYQHPRSSRDSNSGLQTDEWVLLMHGFPDTADMWKDQVAALSAAGYAVIAPDMPGFGKSTFEQPADIKQYSLRNIVALMCGILDQLGVHKAVVVGHDWGAAVAWSFAVQAPHRLSKLAVLSVGHPGERVVGGRVKWPIDPEKHDKPRSRAGGGGGKGISP